MFRADAVFQSGFESALDSGVGSVSLAADEPNFETFIGLQKRAGHHSLDDALADLVTQQATQFAALTPREQAAIAWVEAVVASGKSQSSDGAYRALRRYFDDAEIAKLTALAGTASARAKLGKG